MGDVQKFEFKTPPTGPDAPAPEPKPVDALKIEETPAAPVVETPAAPVVETLPETPDTSPPAEPVKPAQIVSDDELAKFSDEVEKQGQLGEESLKTLESRGVPRDLAARVVRSLQADQAAAVASIQAEAGGADGYAKMAAWAPANLSKPELEAYNKLLGAGDVEAAKIAVRGIYAKFTAKMGSPPATTVQGRSGTPSVVGYRDQHEQTKAIQDPRYNSSAAYRKEVMDRIAVSTF